MANVIDGSSGSDNLSDDTFYWDENAYAFVYGDDRISGYGGDDIISSHGGSDILIGGAGDDIFLLSHDYGQGSTVVVNGGDGYDEVSLLGYSPGYLTPNISKQIISGQDVIVITDDIYNYTVLLINVEKVATSYGVTLFSTEKESAVPDFGNIVISLPETDWLEQSDGSFISSGNATIGKKDGNANLLSIRDGHYSLNKDGLLTINGTAISTAEQEDRTLFSGEFQLSTTALTGTIGDSIDYMTLSGLPIELKSLSLAENDVRIDYKSWFLPLEFSGDEISFDANTIILNENGVSFGANGQLTIPDVHFDLLNVVSIDSKDLIAKYISATEDLMIEGGFIIDSAVFPEVEVQLSDDGLVINDGVVKNVKTTFNVADFEIKGWGFSETSFDLDTKENSAKGASNVMLPFGTVKSLQAELGFLLDPFEVGSAELAVELDESLPIFTTGWLLDSIGGKLENLSNSSDVPVLVGGMIGVSSAIENLYAREPLVGMTISGEVDKNHVKGSVSGHFISEDIVKFKGEAEVNWQDDFIKLSSAVDIYDGFVIGELNFKSDFDFNITTSGRAEINIDTFDLTASGNYLLQYSNDGISSNDYIAGWTTVNKVGFDLFLGGKYFFDGSYDSFGAKEVPIYSSWIVDETIANLRVDITWGNQADEDVKTKVVLYTDNTKTSIAKVFEESDYSQNGISVIEEWTSTFGTSIFISNPTPGLWDVEVVNPDGLGDISYAASTTFKDSVLNIDNVQLGAGSTVISYTALSEESDATVTFFVDDDNDGYDGRLIGSAKELDGSGIFTWDSGSFSAGEYFIYTVMEDGLSIPISDYYEVPIVVGYNQLESRNDNGDLYGGSSNDFYKGGDGNDRFVESLGEDMFHGGSGIDVIVFEGLRSDYSVYSSSNMINVLDKSNDNSRDKLYDIERLEFTDKKMAFDLNGNAGEVAKLLGVVFGSEAVNNSSYVGIGLSLMDQGMAYDELANLALSVAGVVSNEDVVSLLYSNLIGSVPDSATLAHFSSLIYDGSFTQESLTIYSADLAFNENNIKLTGLQASGIEYI